MVKTKKNFISRRPDEVLGIDYDEKWMMILIFMMMKDDDELEYNEDAFDIPIQISYAFTSYNNT